jgi:hypothetical protein
MKRTCVVYLRKDELFIVSAAMTTHGFEIDDAPVCRLAADQAEATIGEAVLRALDAYRTNVPPPGPAGRHPDPVLQFVGVKSWGQLERSSRSISINDESGSIRAIPTRRLPAGGYDYLDELAVQCQAVPEQIGAAIRQVAPSCS